MQLCIIGLELSAKIPPPELRELLLSIKILFKIGFALIKDIPPP